MRIREHVSKVIDGDTAYVVWICGEQRVDGTWQGWSFTRLIPPGLSCARTRRPPNPTALRLTIGPMALSPSTWRVRSPVPRDDFSSRLLPNSPSSVN